MNTPIQLIVSLLSGVADYMVGITCTGDFYQLKMPAKLAAKK